ncbi:hypothetical protein TURU_117901 [Turdus rufiventris]|nr:hypothetical protein TURU_117901 [Turdus rufiventris]
MGKAAALCGGGTRGLVSLLSAVPCLACHELPAMSADPGGRGGGGPAGGPPAAPPGSDTYKGWLFKWTNYLKGYQRRWFVLSNGLLSYYRFKLVLHGLSSSVPTVFCNCQEWWLFLEALEKYNGPSSEDGDHAEVVTTRLKKQIFIFEVWRCYTAVWAGVCPGNQFGKLLDRLLANIPVICGGGEYLSSRHPKGWTQAEMAHTCRGTINLSTAHIDTEDSCNIVLSNGGRTYHLKANSEVERQRWVTALELAKAKAIRMRNNQSALEYANADREPS